MDYEMESNGFLSYAWSQQWMKHIMVPLYRWCYDFPVCRIDDKQWNKTLSFEYMNRLDMVYDSISITWLITVVNESYGMMIMYTSNTTNKHKLADIQIFTRSRDIKANEPLYDDY